MKKRGCLCRLSIYRAGLCEMMPAMSKDVPKTDTEVTDALMARRDLLSGTAAAMVAAASTSSVLRSEGAAASESSDLDFTELNHGIDETHHVADGFNADVLIRWGDPLFADAPTFDPSALTAARQSKQFGYNCDFTG
ncbi:MAG: DUF839 domain-containing protein, partial [Alphaproteobacteria bacterium]|nr:DUF839 domain-containing protein [Alphaproteobacteria bacterium]